LVICDWNAVGEGKEANGLQNPVCGTHIKVHSVLQSAYEGKLIEPVKQAFEMNTTNFNKMGLIKVNGQWRFPTEEDEESEESTDATVDASNNTDNGAPGADAGEDNV